MSEIRVRPDGPSTIGQGGPKYDPDGVFAFPQGITNLR
nr:hypothetical protein [Kibdelosporangium sp. MJ126-NF4]CTQ88543.1 hypothetical protein [Kibdelosporangium sp. MJ126-NF4]